MTFWNIDNEKGSQRSGPSNGVDTRLYETGVDADVNDGETEDDNDHDVLRVLPEHVLLAEQVLMGKTEQEEPKAENLNQNLEKS